MDRVSQDLHIMPPRVPLAMPAQDFRATPRDADAPGTDEHNTVALWRVLAFSPAMMATGLLLWVMTGWFKNDGISLVETLLLALICFNFFWIVFTVSTAILG
ncbi:MAG: glucans biosynthesis glucosyltransferase MdoH, partial [Arenibacterium sp.]